MTLEGFKRAKELSEQCASLEKRIDRIRRLISRIEEIRTESNVTPIRIAEQFMYTPDAAVETDALLEFLNGEIHKVNDKIALCYKEFDEL